MKRHGVSRNGKMTARFAVRLSGERGGKGEGERDRGEIQER